MDIRPTLTIPMLLLAGAVAAAQDGIGMPDELGFGLPDEAPPFAAPMPEPADRGPGALPDQTEQPGALPGRQGVSSNGVDITANYVWAQRRRGTIVMSEGVRAEYQGTTISADRCDYDTDNELALFYPYVVLEREGERIVGEQCLFRFEDRTWTLWNATAELSPSFLSNWTTDFTYLHADRIEGDDVHAVLYDVYFTSCPYARVRRSSETGELGSRERPHWRIQSTRARIWDEWDEIVLGPSTVYLGNVPVFWAPGFGFKRSFWSRLDTFPTVGRNSVEGWYFQWAYRYSGKNLLRIALTEKQGNTYGFDYRYDGRTTRFGVVVSYRTKTNSFTGSADLSTTALGGTFQAGYNLSRASGLAATTSTTESRSISYSNRGSWGDLSLRASQNATISDRRRENTNAQATYRYPLSDTLNFDGSVQYTSNDTVQTGTNTPVANEELQTRAVLTGRQNAFDWELRHEKRIDPDRDRYTGDNNFGFVDRLPEFRANTDLRRIGIPSRTWTLRATGTAGWLYEAATRVTTARYAMDLQGSRSTINIGGTQINVSGDYRQRWYGDNTAIYSLGTRVGIQSKWSGSVRSSFNYNYQTTAGYSPFRFDFMSRYHTASGVVDWQLPATGSRQSAQIGTAFDFRLHRWSDLRLSYMWSGSPGNALNVSTGYDLENGGLRQLVVRYNSRRKGRYDLQLTTGYDFRGKQLSTTRAQFDWEIERDQWRIRWLTTYNPTRSRFEQNAIQLIRYTHCFTYGLSYNAQRGDFRFSVQLRGFPVFSDQSFAIGGQGEFLSPSSGGGEVLF